MFTTKHYNCVVVPKKPLTCFLRLHTSTECFLSEACICIDEPVYTKTAADHVVYDNCYRYMVSVYNLCYFRRKNIIWGVSVAVCFRSGINKQQNDDTGSQINFGSVQNFELFSFWSFSLRAGGGGFCR